MENINNQFDPLLKKLENLSTTTLELWRLKGIQKSIELGSALISNSIALLFLLIGIVFLSIGTALYIGSLLSKSYYGFGIVALFYLLIFTLLIVFGSAIKKCLANTFTKAIFN